MRTTEFSIIDYNPSFTDDHWLCSLNKEESTYHFITTYKDNRFLEQKVIDEIESLQWKNPSLWQVYGLGKQAVIEGLIFENVEQVEEIPQWAKRQTWLGMDLGYTNDPTAIVQVCLYDDTIYIDEVCYQTKMLSSDIIDTIKNRIRADRREYKVISESADPRMIDEIYNAGIDIHPVRKFAGSVMAGIQKMQEFKIRVTKRSTNIIKEFKNYTYRQDKEGKWLNVPIDEFNHCFVANTMIRTLDGLKRIDKIDIGDRVLTSNGYRQVLARFDNGIKEVRDYCIELNNGTTINLTGTKNHLVKTKDGWKQISQLSKGDIVFVGNEKTSKAKSLMEKHSIDTRTNDIFQKAIEGCIVSYGNTIKGLFPKGITFIKETAIQQTIQLITSNVLKCQNIFARTLNNLNRKKDMLRKCVQTWVMREYMLPNGIEVKKAGHGTDSMESKSLKKPNKESLYVKCVAKCFSQRKAIRNSARIIANQNIEGTSEQITSQENARSAEKNLSQASIQEQKPVQELAVVSLSQTHERRERVYDIMVYDTHEYIANGLLVHNCIDAIRYVILEEVLGGYGQGLSAEELADIL